MNSIISKNYFNADLITPLNKINKSKLIHFIGICGVAMGQMAVLTKNLGYHIQGSDKDYYDPIKSLLKKNKINTFLGYSHKNITKDIALAVIGNSVTKDNEEVQKVKELGIPYTIFPALLYDIIIKNNRSIVISGTHGKTTTTALVSFILEKANINPSYFIGGETPDLNSAIKIGKGGASVVEGDEYDSAFFAKYPKFHFYKPNILVITSLEFDHFDVYPDLKSIQLEFKKLLLSLKKNDIVIYCSDFQSIQEIVDNIKPNSPARFISYGIKGQEYKLIKNNWKDTCQTVTARINNQEEFNFSLSIPGEHNALNAIATLSVADALKINRDIFKKNIIQFKGVKRRQEEYTLPNNQLLIEDFAHHPTAVKKTLLALKDKYKKNILLAFEPRSNTSRQNIFKQEFAEAFLNADIILLKYPQPSKRDKMPPLDVNWIINYLQERGKIACAYSNAKQLAQDMISYSNQGYLFVIMSNGSFDNLIEKLYNLN